MKTTYSINAEQNGIEIYFDEKPDTSTINTLKSDKWRWHNVKKCWYNRNTPDNLKFAESVINGEPASASKPFIYGKNVSDYLTLDEFRDALERYYRANNRYTEDQVRSCTEFELKHRYNTNDQYANLSGYIRQAIIWKSIGGEVNKFQSNGDHAIYSAIWDKLPTIEGLKPTGKVYSAMWGYDQTQITTAKHYGRAFGLDVLVTGGFGSGEVLLKRISKDGRFSDGCIDFTPNTFTEKEIQETNEYAMNFGH
jgi:hypothetical protein